MKRGLNSAALAALFVVVVAEGAFAMDVLSASHALACLLTGLAGTAVIRTVSIYRGHRHAG